MLTTCSWDKHRQLGTLVRTEADYSSHDHDDDPVMCTFDIHKEHRSKCNRMWGTHFTTKFGIPWPWCEVEIYTTWFRNKMTVPCPWWRIELESGLDVHLQLWGAEGAISWDLPSTPFTTTVTTVSEGHLCVCQLLSQSSPESSVRYTSNHILSFRGDIDIVLRPYSSSSA